MQPLVLKPIIKCAPWGGRRLGTVLGKPLGSGDDYSESWEVSDVGDDQSIVVGGELQGWSLAQLVQQRHSELLGVGGPTDQFPLLVKFLDAQRTLSVQVHPSDEQARSLPQPAGGKAEAWVIISAEPGSHIYTGLRAGVDEAQLRQQLSTGELTECLHRLDVRAGDCIYIPPGTVHAIGAGILLAEVQQSSDTTYRLFDWNRTDATGQPRPLHVEQAMQCIDFDLGPVNATPPTPVETASHRQVELMSCEFFTLHRHIADSPFTFAADGRFRVLMILDGAADLVSGNDNVAMTLGQTVLLPAERNDVHITPRGRCTILDAFPE